MTAQSLEDFIYWFTPPGWQEHIGKVMFVPLILDSEMSNIKDGKLPERLQHPRFVEAVNAYFKR